MTAISKLQQVTSEYQNYKNSLNTAQAALNNVISQGTVLYNDTTFSELFPNSINTYKTYLQNVQSAINTFISGFPSEPPLNG